MGNPVHSSSESICNISSSDAVNSGLESTNTLSRESQNLDTVDSTRQILADTAGNVAREVVLHYPIETIAGIVAGTTMFKHVWNTTPGNSVYKGLVGLGMFAGAQGIVIGNEYLQNKYMTSISSSSSSISSSALTSSTSQNNNTETSSSQSLIDMANSYPIHSPNEEINSITILDSVNKFFLNWMQSTSGTKNRLPANIDMINWDTPLFFYSFYNFIIYTMYTALLYFVITIVVFYSLNYIWTNMKYLSCVEKVFTILSGGAANDFNKKIIEFMTSLMGKILMIVKAVLISLFLIILVSSTYLYINYDFSSDLANHFNTTMKGVSNASTNFTMMYKVGDIETYYYQKFSEVILVLMIGIYRGYYLIRPLQYSSNIKAAIGFIVSLFVRSVTSFIMNVVLVGNVKIGITFIELFNAYNITINLVFYCVLSFLSLVVIEYILFKKIKVITMPKEKNKFNQKEGDSQDFYPYSLFYNILFIFMKVGTSLAFFGVFEGVLFLYTHYLPANVYYLCS